MFEQFPKVRPPLPQAIADIYATHYKQNREGGTAASSLAQRLESWLHRQVARDVQAGNASRSTLEIGAGTLNQLAYEPMRGSYDIVEPFRSLFEGSPLLARIRHSYAEQQFAYTSGKNATDSSLIIDAMDLMYTGRFDGMCLVSSDSDFTRLAQRLREEGLLVFGFGERKTPDAFVQACDKFIYTEVLRPDVAPAAATPATRPSGRTIAPAKSGTRTRAPAQGPEAAPQNAASAPAATDRPGKLPLPLEMLRRAIEEASDEQGWAQLGAVGTYLTKIRPDFDPRLFGHKKLSDLLKHHPRHFALEERGTGSGARSIYVRALG